MYKTMVKQLIPIEAYVHHDVKWLSSLIVLNLHVPRIRRALCRVLTFRFSVIFRVRQDILINIRMNCHNMSKPLIIG